MCPEGFPGADGLLLPAAQAVAVALLPLLTAALTQPAAPHWGRKHTLAEVSASERQSA